MLPRSECGKENWMIKLNRLAQTSVYLTSPYWSHIDLTGAYIKSVKWDGDEGVMVAVKNNQPYKLGLFPKLYKGDGDLKQKTEKDLHHTARKITVDLDKVGTRRFGLGYIYNLKQFEWIVK